MPEPDLSRRGGMREACHAACVQVSTAQSAAKCSVCAGSVLACHVSIYILSTSPIASPSILPPGPSVPKSHDTEGMGATMSCLLCMVGKA